MSAGFFFLYCVQFFKIITLTIAIKLSLSLNKQNLGQFSQTINYLRLDKSAELANLPLRERERKSNPSSSAADLCTAE